MPGLWSYRPSAKPSWAAREAARKAKQAESWERMKEAARARVAPKGQD